MLLIIQDEISGSQEESLDKLFRSSFWGLTLEDSPKVDMRAIKLDGSVIGGHAAVSIKELVLNRLEHRVAVLGLVCVNESHRGLHLGHKLVEELHSSVNLPFVLNCGVELVPYYSAIGYIKVSDSASYLRDGIIVVDNDPVLFNGNCLVDDIDFDNDPIYLGTDF